MKSHEDQIFESFLYTLVIIVIHTKFLTLGDRLIVIINMVNTYFKMGAHKHPREREGG